MRYCGTPHSNPLRVRRGEEETSTSSCCSWLKMTSRYSRLPETKRKLLRYRKSFVRLSKTFSGTKCDCRRWSANCNSMFYISPAIDECFGGGRVLLSPQFTT